MRYRNCLLQITLIVAALFITPTLGLAGPREIQKIPQLQLFIGAEFRARVDRVLDGDNMRVAVSPQKSLLSFVKRDQHVWVRLPVLTFASAESKSKQWLLENVRGKKVTVYSEKLDVQGRVVGDITLPDGRSLSEILENMGLVRIMSYTLPLGALAPSQELLDAGRFEEAVAFLQHQLGFDPDHSASRNSVIRQLRRLGYGYPGHH